jgi:hypothetical protein
MLSLHVSGSSEDDDTEATVWTLSTSLSARAALAVHAALET